MTEEEFADACEFWRPMFEEWYEAEAMPLEADWFKREADGDWYALDYVQWKWMGFKGCLYALHYNKAPLATLAGLASGELVAVSLEELMAIKAKLEKSAEPFDSACMSIRAMIEAAQKGE